MLTPTPQQAARANSARHAALLIASLGALAAAACAGDNSRGGVLVISSAGDADALFPPTAGAGQSREVTDLVFDRLAEIPRTLNSIGDSGWAPRLARRWDWPRDSMAVTFHLDPKATWHDGTPVHAPDVQFAFQVYTDPKLHSSSGADIATVVDSISVVDSLTCTAWFKRRSPERFYTLAYNLVPLPAHLLSTIPHDSLAQSAFAHQPVGNGPYQFVRWDHGARLEIAAVKSFYRGQVGPARVIWTIVPDIGTAVQRVFSGDADFIEQLTPADAAEASKHPEIQTLHLHGTQFAFMVFNTRDGATDKPNPILGDRAMRRALTMALDREAMVHNVFDSLARVPLGPLSRLQWPADSTIHQLPFDRAAAAKLLDSLGWRAGPGGLRSRGGKPLAISLLTPTSSKPRMQYAVLIQEQLRQVGVKVNINMVENAAMGDRMHAHAFDALILLIGASPSPAGVHQGWSTAAISMANGYNVGRFSNPMLDAEIDSAVTATSLTSARAHYRTVYQTLVDDAPAVWLYEPVVFMAANRRITLAPMRDDAWWASIPDWRLKPATRRAQDTTKGKH